MTLTVSPNSEAKPMWAQLSIGANRFYWFQSVSMSPQTTVCESAQSLKLVSVVLVLSLALTVQALEPSVRSDSEPFKDALITSQFQCPTVALKARIAEDLCQRFAALRSPVPLCSESWLSYESSRHSLIISKEDVSSESFGSTLMVSQRLIGFNHWPLRVAVLCVGSYLLLFFGKPFVSETYFCK